ncbi:SgcJ/EcaC family oxidoreductase [Kibdelosporangium phytohabitans]|uniref:DUF4440 domain-containing protein n=1 Tax=Kibdelosporangium phytohabitans TaxID=860235 RepID=A0A0N9I4E5_9PSEU|nr:SgcJ/EcaC family oxidoreductase [Kibdelosporangium phytohabitans]ALG10757.1 hypothetical protein AOZ06_31165 [Kibdelosporangium phytohabitans]MBE1461910.1 uncharacterized protein (TIGR02246 family) [Kibdelosporangium phytohabitans]
MSVSAELVTEPADADKAAIAALTQKVVAAWAYNDAEKFADTFIENGTMILAGVFCRNREEVRQYMTEAYKGRYKGTQVTGKPISMRTLGDNAAILLSRGGVLEAGETETNDKQAIHASWVAVRHGSEWRLAAYQNTPVHSI